MGWARLVRDKALDLRPRAASRHLGAGRGPAPEGLLRCGPACGKRAGTEAVLGIAAPPPRPRKVELRSGPSRAGSGQGKVSLPLPPPQEAEVAGKPPGCPQVRATAPRCGGHATYLSAEELPHQGGGHLLHEEAVHAACPAHEAAAAPDPRAWPVRPRCRGDVSSAPRLRPFPRLGGGRAGRGGASSPMRQKPWAALEPVAGSGLGPGSDPVRPGGLQPVTAPT